jgi:hypothetical protein
MGGTDLIVPLLVLLDLVTVGPLHVHVVLSDGKAPLFSNSWVDGGDGGDGGRDTKWPYYSYAHPSLRAVISLRTSGPLIFERPRFLVPVS